MCKRAGPYEYNDPIIKFNGRPGALAGCAIVAIGREAVAPGRGWETPSDSDTPVGSDWSETDAHARRVVLCRVFRRSPPRNRRPMTLSFFSAGNSPGDDNTQCPLSTALSVRSPPAHCFPAMPPFRRCRRIALFGLYPVIPTAIQDHPYKWRSIKDQLFIRIRGIVSLKIK